jgi:hypothetical protein
VVAGQDAEAAGIVGQHLRDAELHREVGDAGGHGGGILLLIPHRPGQVVVQIGGQRVQAAQERLILGQFVEPLGVDDAQQFNRVLVRLRPQVGVDRREEILRRFVP